MNRLAFAFGISAAAAALAAIGERDAAACGGCFHPPTQTASDITDERMLLSVSPTQTTLYDQIRYAGNPTSFAWVLPIHGTVTVGLSADVLFDSVDELTATQIVAPPQNCPGLPQSCQSNASFGAATPSAAGGGGGGGGVTVTKSQNVGPYETVQLHATDSGALNNWLAQNGFSIPADVTPIIDQYVTEGFDFLAMKLLPDAGVQAMRPVRVTMPGASVSLPLRMAAIGTGATVGITIWVVSDGRYEPQNFPFFHIEDTQLVWDWSTNSSNYTTLRAQNEATLNGKGWELESSLSVNEQTITNVILSGGQYYGGGGISGAPASDASEDYLPVTDPTVDGGAPIETAEQVRTDDVGNLFAGLTGPNVRITRIRSDISHAAMTTDFVLQASSDQSELSNIRSVSQSVNLQCPVYQDCSVVGYASPEQAAADMAAGSGGKSSFGCVAATSGANVDPATTMAVLGSALGLVMVKVIRARKRAAKKA